jgi:outer membrane protein assembly factor BamB
MRFFVASLLISTSFLVFQNASPARAENWPHWRGPAWNGSTTESNLPDHWSKTENIAWVAPLPGRSGATPVIWEDSVFLPSPDAEGKLLLFCFGSKDGKLRWQQTVARGNTVSGKNNMASPSAVTDGKRVVIMFGTGVLAAYDFAGKELWSRNLARQYGKLALMWLYGSSPLLYHDRLYVEVLQRADPSAYRHAVDGKPRRDSFLLCLDPQTGEEHWRQLRKTDAVEESQDAYTSPIAYQTGNSAEILVYGADYVTSHNPESGDELWRSGSLNSRKIPVWRTIASPVAGPEGVFACVPRANGPTLAIAGKAGGPAKAAVTWRSTAASSDVPSPLYYQGKLFVLDGNRQRLTRVDPKTGTTLWNCFFEADEVFSASPTGADGKVYCIGEQGTVLVASAGDTPKIISKFSMAEEAGPGGPILSTIAVANRHLFVRTARSLYCVGQGGRSLR